MIKNVAKKLIDNLTRERTNNVHVKHRNFKEFSDTPYFVFLPNKPFANTVFTNTILTNTIFTNTIFANNVTLSVTF